MKNRYPEIKPGFARSILLILIVIAAFLGAWQYGLLDKLLPRDILTWVWVSAMLGWFLWSVVFHALPYQSQVDAEVRDFYKAISLLENGNRRDFEKLFNGTLSAGRGRMSRVAEVFRLVSQQGRQPDDIRENVNLDNLLGYATAADRLSSKGKKLVWIIRDLLTFGILGTYVGISIGVIGADASIAGDSDETRAYVAYLLSSIGLALLTTLAGLITGSLFLQKLQERAQVTFDRILNQLSVEVPTSGYLGWVNAGRPGEAQAASPPGEE